MSVCLSICRSVCHNSQPCKNGCTDRDAVWVDDSGGPKEPCIRSGPDPPWGNLVHPIVKYRDTATAVPYAKTAEPIEVLFGFWAWMGQRNHMLDGNPAVLRDVAMATNYGTQFAIAGFMSFIRLRISVYHTTKVITLVV